MPVKTEPTVGDGGVLTVTLMKASSCNYCRPTRAAPGETLGSGVPDRTMASLWCRFSLGSIVCGAALHVRGRRREHRLDNLARSFGGDVKSCLTDRCYALSCLVGRCYARQIFQGLQAVSAGDTWQHGAEVYQWRPRRAQLFARREEVPFGAVVASTIARPSKVDASVQF